MITNLTKFYVTQQTIDTYILYIPKYTLITNNTRRIKFMLLLQTHSWAIFIHFRNNHNSSEDHLVRQFFKISWMGKKLDRISCIEK